MRNHERVVIGVDDEQDTAMELLIALGRAFHQAGVPTDQLEAIMRRAARALGLELQVTALPTSITAAIGTGQAQRIVLLRLEPGVINLRKLALLNLVYNRVLARMISNEIALHEVERDVGFGDEVGAPQTILAYCALSLGASILLGGHVDDDGAAAIIGALVGVLSLLGRRWKALERLFEVLAAFTATVVVASYSTWVHPLTGYIPIVAGSIVLLPGLQLTAALRELAFRNLVAGTARLGAVLMTLLSLGCGFALGLGVVGPNAFHMASLAPTTIPWYDIALAAGAVAFGVQTLQNARLSDVPWVCGACGVAELAYRAFAALPAHQVATFGGALVVGLMTSLGERFARVPQAVLLVPGLMILVPGALSYTSVLYLLSNNGADGAAIAASSAVSAVEIVAGLLLAQLLTAAES
jgi:uncharacterized membrane protein YjjP (DUF1212 family)